MHANLEPKGNHLGVTFPAHDPVDKAGAQVFLEGLQVLHGTDFRGSLHCLAAQLGHLCDVESPIPAIVDEIQQQKHQVICQMPNAKKKKGGGGGGACELYVQKEKRTSSTYTSSRSYLPSGLRSVAEDLGTGSRDTL